MKGERIMQNRETENRVQQAFSHLAPPDVLESVLSDCQARNLNEEKGTVLSMPEKQKAPKWVKWAAGAAAALVLAAGGAGYYQINHLVASTVSLDVNPSIEIKVKKKEKVLEVIPRNEDAQVITGDMDFRGSDLELTVNALIGSMLRNGYLSEIANSILVSVDSKDSAKGEALEKKLTEEINEFLKTNDFSGSVLSQTLAADSEQQKLAEDYGITLGKAQLIQEIMEKDPRHTFADLASLSINELNLLHSSDAAQPAVMEISTTGNASEKAYIGEAKAKAAALSHAGLKEDQISRYQMEFDYEHGVMVYEIEFYADGYEYGYDINAATGDIVSHERERDDDFAAWPQQGSAAANSAEYISEASAKSIALKHAGLQESSVNFIRSKIDYDDGRAVYDVEFWSGSTEYDYEIDAVSGEIIGYDYDIETYQPSASQNGSYISEASAKSIALKHAGLQESSVNFIRSKIDYDDGRAVYDVEFWSGSTEYDYEIDAVSGEIIGYDYDAEGDQPSSQGSGDIGAEKAKSIAFSHAGVSSSSVYSAKCELDYDDGRRIYEVEFKSGGYEFGYDIDASNGNILQHEKERDD